MMKAAILSLSPNPSVSIKEKEKATLAPDQVLIKISAAALNRRDYWITKGLYPGLKDGVTLGSDGCGTIAAIGDKVETNFAIGDRVLINPNINWGTSDDFQDGQYHILGMPTDGTLAEYMLTTADRLVKAPEHLTDEQAAAIPLAALTAYRAIFTQGHLMDGQTVLITGIGGGVAQWALKLASYQDVKLLVSSGSDAKIEYAQMHGAAGGYNYKDDKWHKKLIQDHKGVDLIIDGVGGDALNAYIDVLKPGGRVVCYGATQSPKASLNLAKLFWKQVTIQGSTMGSDKEFESMVRYINHYQIVPLIDSIRPFDDLSSALEEMGKGSQMGKMVLTFN